MGEKREASRIRNHEKCKNNLMSFFNAHHAFCDGHFSFEKARPQFFRGRAFGFDAFNSVFLKQ